MSDVLLLPLGVGEAFTAENYTTCLALGRGDDWLLIDCPHPVRKMLREASRAAGLDLDLDKIRGVALSHLHADHACGLEDYLYYSYFALKRRAQIATHPDSAARLWPDLLAAGMDSSKLSPDAPPLSLQASDYFDLTPLDESRPVPFGPFSIECRPTQHSIPTTAFRITIDGRTLGFSADTTFDPTLIDWLSPCDLILHEVTNLPDSPVHTPYRHLAGLPEALRSKMRLFHYPDDFDRSAGLIEMLRQGQLIRLR